MSLTGAPAGTVPAPAELGALVRGLLLRAAAAGLAGGAVAFVFARVLAEPLIDRAIEYQDGRGMAEAAVAAATGAPSPHDMGPDLFSRAVQANVGFSVGMLAFGLAVGCLFGVVYCLAYGRVAVSARVLSLLVAAGMFVVLYLVPFLKYPGNPPAVGNADTIGQRAGLYGVMVVGSVFAAAAALWIGHRLAARLGRWNATLVGGLVFVVAVVVVGALLPPLGTLAANVATTGPLLSETPQPLRDAAGTIVFPGFDGDVLYWFRLYAVGAQVLLWTVIGLVFAPLAQRLVDRTA